MLMYMIVILGGVFGLLYSRLIDLILYSYLKKRVNCLVSFLTRMFILANIVYLTLYLLIYFNR